MYVNKDKRLIKYLIWIALITAMLIFVPLKRVNAETVTKSYANLQSDKSLFCLNHGNPFRGSVTFNVTNLTR